MADVAEIALRLGAALLAGAAIGINRDLHGKPAGVRLNALVALAAALFVLLAGELTRLGATPEGYSRILQGLLGGIGFLGAGVIIRDESARRIQNLTTAATILVTAGLGAACGLGAWPLAGLAAAGALVVLILGLVVDRLLYGKMGPEDF
jgi:putative Mg2+ transporter-C (MgtC) family protein